MEENRKTKTMLLKDIDKAKRNKICNFFDISESALRKSLVQCCGETKINMLKLSFDSPQHWTNIYNSISDMIDSFDENDFINYVTSIYSAVTHETKFKKYKQSIKNDSRVMFEKSCIANIISDMHNVDKQDMLEFYSYLVFSHCQLLLNDIDMLVKAI